MNEKDPSFKLYLISQEGVEDINLYKKLPSAGKFEVLLFATNVVLNVYRMKNPLKFSLVQAGYFEYLNEYINKNNSVLNIEDVEEFINSRFAFYSEELNNANNPNYILGKTFNVFYVEPLCIEPKDNFDLLNIFQFSNKLREVVKSLISKVGILNMELRSGLISEV